MIAHFLFEAFPDEDEGRLTRVRSAIVSTPALAKLGKTLGLSSELHLGRGLERGRLSDAVLADAVEALFGAVFLDGGFEAARAPILWGLADTIEAAVVQGGENWKSRLQELTQQVHKMPPSYVVLSESGPDHRKEFFVAVRLEDEELGRGQGPSKKLAEQAAAREALRSFGA